MCVFFMVIFLNLLFKKVISTFFLKKIFLGSYKAGFSLELQRNHKSMDFESWYFMSFFYE